MDELQKLYDVLKRDGYYTKSFDEFVAKWEDGAYRDKVYQVVSRDGLYTKDKESFLTKYSSAPQQPTQQPTQQPEQQPVVQPTVKKKDDMDSDWLFGDGSSESEPSKTEQAFTAYNKQLNEPKTSDTDIISRAQKVIGIKEPQQKQVEPKKELDLAYVMGTDVAQKQLQEKMTPQREEYLAKPLQKIEQKAQFEQKMEKIEEATPEYLRPSIRTIEQSVEKSLENFVGDMNYQFGDAGFEFKDLRNGYFEIKAPDGTAETIRYHLGAEPAKNVVSASVNYFIKTKSAPLKGIDKIEKMYKDENKKFATEYQVESELSLLSKEQERTAKEASDFLKRKQDAETALKAINELPFEKRTANYRDDKFQAEQIVKRIYEEGAELQKKIDAIPEKQKNLEIALGKYNSKQEKQGTWVGGIYNSMLSFIDNTVAGATDIAIDYVANFNPLSGYMTAEQKDKIAKDMKYGTKDELTFMEGARNAFRTAFGDKNTSEQWESLTKQSFVGGAVLGAAEFVPSMLIPGAWFRRAAMYASVNDMVNQEFESNPELQNVSENEKLFVKVPIGIVGAVLEEYGVKNIVQNTALVKSITGRAILKATEGMAPAAFKKVVSNEISEMIADGTLRILGGGIMEFETGFAQQGVDIGVKSIFNAAKGKKLFDTPDTVVEIGVDMTLAGAQEMIGSVAVTTPMVVAAAYRKKDIAGIPSEYFNVFVESANDKNAEKAFIATLKNNIISGDMTNKEAVDLLNNYRNSVGLLSSIQPELNNAEKKQAMVLLRERKELEDKKDKIDPALAKPIQDKINQINEQLTQLTEDAIQKQAASEVSLQPEAGAGQEVEVGGPEAKPKITPEESKRKEDLVAAFEDPKETEVLEDGKPFVYIKVGEYYTNKERAQAELDALNQKEQALVTEQVGMEQAEGLGTQLEAVAKEEIPAEGLDAEEKARKKNLEEALADPSKLKEDGTLLVQVQPGVWEHNRVDAAQAELDQLNKVEQLRLKEAAAKNKEKSVPAEGLGTQLETVAKEEVTPAEVTPAEQFTEQDRARKAELEEAMRKADKRRKNITVGETTMPKAEAKAELDALNQKEQAAQQPVTPTVTPTATAPVETMTAEQEADLLEELMTGKKKEPVAVEPVVETVAEEEAKPEIPKAEEVAEVELEIKDIEATPEETQKQVEEFNEEALPEQEKPKAGQVAELSIDEINADPERFQYKEVTDKEAGVTEKFKGEKAPFKKELAGVISVWVDPSDGKTYVINGHHRLDFAKRSGEKTMNVIYIDAKNASEARLKGAMQNIAEGMGTDMDAAKVFRETGMTVEQVQASGISVKGAKAMNGLALASLSDNLFNLVVQGKLSQTVGIIIGSTIKNQAVQEQFYNVIKGKNLNNGTIKVMAEDIQAAPTENVEQMDLFGVTATEQASYQQRASFIAGIRAIVSKAKNILGKAAKSKGFLEEYGNDIDEIASETGSRESAMALAVFDRLRNTSPEIRALIDKGVERIKNGENKNKVLNETAKQIIEATPRILEGVTGQPVAGRGEVKEPGTKGKQGATGKKLADAVRKNLKIKGPDGLQSNILGILPAIWNAGVETMATAIEAGVAVTEAVQKAIEYIKEKHGKKFNEAAAEKKLLIGHYKGAIEIAREAKVTNEGLKTYFKRQGLTDAQIETLLKVKEKAEKKPISKEKVIGKPKPKKVTVNEMTALKDQIRLEARAAREAKGDLNAKRKMLAAAIKEMQKKGKITVRQAKALINRVNAVNLDNPVMVERLLDYAEKVFNDAAYAEKLSKANKLQSQIKQLSKNKDKFGNLTAFAAEFAKIDPAMVENIDEYIEMASKVKEGVQGSKIVGDKVIPADMVDVGATMEYVNKTMEAQEEAIRLKTAERLQELMGVDVSDLSMAKLQELMDLVKAEALAQGEQKEKLSDKINEIFGTNKDKEKAIRDGIQRMFDTYSTIIKDMFETGIDPFSDPENPTTVEFKDSDKKIVEEFMDMDLSLLDKKEALRAADALNNFLTNKSTAGMLATLGDYNGRKNIKEVADKNIKAEQIKMYWSPILGRTFFQQISSIPAFFDRLFKSYKTGRYIREMMGINSLINHKADAVTAANRVISNYILEFSKKKPNNKNFQDISNIIERGIIGDLAKTIVGDAKQVEAEFNRRKKLIEQSIKILEESGTKKETEQAKVMKEVYDKIAKDSKTIEEVKAKADQVNVDAVQFWVDQWAKLYDQFADVALNVYNRVLDKNVNYVPDRFGFLERAEKKKKDADGFESMFVANSNSEYFYKKEAGSLMKSTPPQSLLDEDGNSMDMYVNLSFDTNNANALMEALIDIKTAADIRQIQAFKNDSKFNDVFPFGKDAAAVKERIAALIRNIRNKRTITDKSFKEMVRKMDRIAAIGTSLLLAGPTQAISQTIPVAINTLVNSGGKLNLSNINNKDVNRFIDESGMGIANRGSDAVTELETLNQKLEVASKTKAGAVVQYIENLNRKYLKLYLSNFDVFIARASWITYYEKGLRKQGIKGKVDYSTHKLNKEAAQYAQDMIDRQQNISDKDLAGQLYQSDNPVKQFIVKVVMPLATFRMNQTTRFSNDLAIFTSKTASIQEKKEAALSIGGFAAEMATFRAIKLYIGYYVFNSLAQMIRGEEDDEEEKQKTWDNMKKGAATSVVSDVFSPIPMTDVPTKILFAGVLDQLQNIAGVGEDDKFNIFTESKSSFTSDWGLLGVGVDKMIKLGEKVELARTGKFKDDFGNEKTISESDRALLSNPLYIGINVATVLGINPFAPETDNVMNRITKMAKKNAMSNEQLKEAEELGVEGKKDLMKVKADKKAEKEEAYGGYETLKEFEEKEPEKFDEYSAPGGKLDKYREQERKEDEEKNKDEPFRGLSEKKFKELYPVEWAKKYGPGTAYFQKQNSPAMLQKKAQEKMREAQREQKRKMAEAKRRQQEILKKASGK